ncbi:hypothetical protein BBP40_004090 [Aspergillus hancockii]|nr:hypothetical protein BBP40_004090 [Aspergillus hancockii]
MADSNKLRPDIYPKLSRPSQSMKAAYDVVVVGSGYGAGVAASRMARAGKSVAVLELGWKRRREYSPTLMEITVSGYVRWLPPGKPTKLFQLLLGDGQYAFVAHGLHKEEVTVHPLGGASMSRDGTGRKGVTNHLGQVFTGHGNEAHQGLVCCDASIVPAALVG